MNAITALVLRVLLLTLAYVFVGRIGYIIYQDLRAQFRSKAVSGGTPIILRSVVDQEPIEKHFIKPEIILGRDPDCDFTINDETISLRHCKLSYHHKQWWAVDLESTNGSFLNDNLIDSAIIITDGDELRLGKVSIHIIINP